MPPSGGLPDATRSAGGASLGDLSVGKINYLGKNSWQRHTHDEGIVTINTFDPSFTGDYHIEGRTMYGEMMVGVPEGHRLDIEYDPDDGVVGGHILVNGNPCLFQGTLAPGAWLEVRGWLGLAGCTYTAAGSLITADGIGGDHPDDEIWGIMGGVTTTQDLDGDVGSAQPAGNGVIRAGGYLNGSISPGEPDLDDPWPEVRTWLRWYRGSSPRPWYASADLLNWTSRSWDCRTTPRRRRRGSGRKRSWRRSVRAGFWA